MLPDLAYPLLALAAGAPALVAVVALSRRAVRRRTRPDNLMALADALHDTRDPDERRNR